MQECLSHCFAVRFQLACKQNTCNVSPFTSRKIIHFMKNTLFRQYGETHVSFRTLQSVLEWGVSRKLFPYENWVNFWKEYCLLHKVFSGINIHFQVHWRNTASLGRKPSILEAVVSTSMFPYDNSYLMKGILALNVFKDQNHSLYENALFRWNGELDVSFGSVQSVLEAGVSNTLLPYENWDNFRKEYWLLLRVFKWEKH
jgi:hypothetical protein